MTYHRLVSTVLCDVKAFSSALTFDTVDSPGTLFAYKLVGLFCWLMFVFPFFLVCFVSSFLRCFR